MRWLSARRLYLQAAFLAVTKRGLVWRQAERAYTGKVTLRPLERMHLPCIGREPIGGNTTIVCDAWPVRRQTYGYLTSRKATPPIGWYQIILLGDRGTCV